MISQEQFDQIEIKHGCGYWNVCWDNACPCAIVTENKGLQESIYNSLIKESQEMSEQFEDDDLAWEYEEDEECDMEFDSVKSDYEINMWCMDRSQGERQCKLLNLDIISWL